MDRSKTRCVPGHTYAHIPARPGAQYKFAKVADASGLILLPGVADCETRRASGRGTKVLVCYLAAESEFLQIIKADSALDIGECFYRRHLQPLVHLPAGQRPSELSGECIQMLFDHAVHVDQLAVDIIEHFHVRLSFHEIQRCCATKGFHVAFELREQWRNIFGQAAFPTDPWNNRLCFSHAVSPFLLIKIW